MSDKQIPIFALLCVFVACVLATTGYGIYLGFVASVVVGFAFVIMTPLAFATGATMLLFGVNLAERLTTALGLS